MQRMRKILNDTAEFLGIYFQLPVKIRDDLPLSVIPASAKGSGAIWDGSKSYRLTSWTTSCVRGFRPTPALASR